MSAIEKLPEEKRSLLEPLRSHSDWQGFMNKELAQLVIEGKADAREVADFLLARFVRKVA